VPGAGVEHGERRQFDLALRVTPAADADGHEAGQEGEAPRPSADVRLADGRAGLRGAGEEASRPRVADDPRLAPGRRIVRAVEARDHRPQIVHREDQPVPRRVCRPAAIGLESAERRGIQHAPADSHAVDVPRIAGAGEPDPAGDRSRRVEQRQSVDRRAGDDEPAAVPNDSVRIDHAVEPAIRNDALVVVHQELGTRADPGRGAQHPIEHAVVHGDPKRREPVDLLDRPPAAPVAVDQEEPAGRVRATTGDEQHILVRPLMRA